MNPFFRISLQIYIHLSFLQHLTHLLLSSWASWASAFQEYLEGFNPTDPVSRDQLRMYFLHVHTLTQSFSQKTDRHCKKLLPIYTKNEINWVESLWQSPFIHRQNEQCTWVYCEFWSWKSLVVLQYWAFQSQGTRSSSNMFLVFG